VTHDLVIRNGMLVDGTGLPRSHADVAVDAGRITAVGTVRDAGTEEVDAEGHVVTPGFVDGHTHMDAQVFWDPFGTSSCWHGVTTVVMGNCGFTLAPARPDARGFADGDRFELGGGVRVEVIHAPGHTRGHCFFRILPDDVVYLADVDLSSFGPYYGDAWSDLEDFERTLAQARGIDARHYATFHHIGVLDGRAAFLDKLERFSAVIADREARLLAYLGEPRSADEITEHRFVYRPQDPVPFASAVERRSMSQHLARLVRNGRVREVEPGHYLRSAA
jgi:glyoxylase-like metal-dependent hydrolase (beta-lactamase superfamily II)